MRRNRFHSGRRALAVALAGCLCGVAYGDPLPSLPDQPGDSTASPSTITTIQPPPPGTPSGTSPAPAPPTITPIPSVAPAAPVITDAPLPTVTSSHVDTVGVRPRTGVLLAGLALLVAGYTGDVGFTYGYHHEPSATSLIPIAGPWLQLTQHYGLSGPPIDTGSASADAAAQKTVDNANSTIRGLAITGEVVSGAMQAVGVVMVVAGAIAKRRVARYADAKPDAKGRTFVSKSLTGTASTPIPSSSFFLRF